MKTDKRLLEENVHFVNLAETLIGCVTPNFRAVAFEWSGNEIMIYFMLERDNMHDRDEIKDIVSEFEAFQPLSLGVSHTVVVDNHSPRERLPGRLVYARKEQGKE
jgi:hypothetical protein